MIIKFNGRELHPVDYVGEYWQKTPEPPEDSETDKS